jgi:hypothetical protein
MDNKRYSRNRIEAPGIERKPMCIGPDLMLMGFEFFCNCRILLSKTVLDNICKEKIARLATIITPLD